jgi:hypothetical protein
MLLPVALAVLAPLPCGCSHRGPAVQMVLGRVTLDGQPVGGATVTFSPVDGGDGLPAVGVSQDDGSFKLTAVRGGAPERGTMVGDYTVTFMKLTHTPPGKEPPPPVAGPMPVFRLLPQAYEEAATSGLRATVKRGVNQGPDFTFDLRSDFRGVTAGDGGAAGRAAP